MAAGENPKAVAELLGNSDPGLTLCAYSHASDGLKVEVFSRLSQIYLDVASAE